MGELDSGFCEVLGSEIHFPLARMSLEKSVFEQLSFDFMKEPEAPFEASPDPEPIPLDKKCRNLMCSKQAKEGRAYCSKAHSPYGQLADEPDNAPIEGWVPPEGFYQWNIHRNKAASRN